jgi:hypothetical protein
MNAKATKATTRLRRYSCMATVAAEGCSRQPDRSSACNVVWYTNSRRANNSPISLSVPRLLRKVVQTQRIKLKERNNRRVPTFPRGRPIPRILVVVFPPFNVIRRRSTQSRLIDCFLHGGCWVGVDAVHAIALRCRF